MIGKMKKLQIGNEVLGWFDPEAIVGVIKHQQLNTSIVFMSHGPAIGNFIITGHSTHDVVREIEAMRGALNLDPSAN